MAETEHSISRGHEGFQSTGGGGAGNIRWASASHNRLAPDIEPDDFSPTCGREPIANSDRTYLTGRGGTDTLRLPSQDPWPRAKAEEVERGSIREYAAAHEGAVYSRGRGGIGPLPSRDPAVSTNSTAKFSTAHDGEGNIVSDDGHMTGPINEKGRRTHTSATKRPHSTLKGGAANITPNSEPVVEHNHHDAPQVESTGRGGKGDVVRDCDRSSSPSSPPCFMNGECRF